MLKKMNQLSIILIVSMILGLITGCSPTATPAVETAAPEPTAAPAATQSTTKAGFDPDRTEDKISSDQLEAKFGEVPAPEAGLAVGALEKNLANEFWLALEKGYKNMATKYGITLDSQASRTETDLQGQLSILETMAGKSYGAYLLSPLSNENLNSVVDGFKANGVPVVNVNCEYLSQADVFVGASNLELGNLAAAYIGDKLGGKGKVIIIEGVPGSYTSTNRVEGFKATMVKDFAGIEIVASQPADYEMEKGMNVATNLLSANPDIKAIYAANDNMALGAVEALRSANKLGSVIVLGIDGTSGAFDSIRKGELTATIDQFPEKSGEIAMQIILRLMGKQKLPRVITTPILVVDKDNISTIK